MVLTLAGLLSVIGYRGYRNGARTQRIGGRFRRLTDHLPWPVWLRDQDGEIIDANRAFRAISPTTGTTLEQTSRTQESRRGNGPAHDPDAPRDPFFQSARVSPLAERALKSGIEQSESVTLSLSGHRLLFDVTEVPLDASGPAGPQTPATIGFARDLTDLEEAQRELARHIAAQDQMLESMTSGIAVFGSDTRLRFHNEAYCEIWRLEEAELADSPGLGTILDRLRERRLLPETADFPAFKRTRDALFTNLVESMEEYLYLPDERTIRLTASPHPMDGIIMMFDDVTDRITLERSHNTLTAVQRMTLDALREGVCVFGGDGRLKLYNEVFSNLFSLDPGWLAEGPHVSELLDRTRDIMPETENWQDYRDRIISYVAEPRSRGGRMTLSDDRVIEYVYVPLPDGQCLMLYMDTTDTHRVAIALHERNEAFARADLLKSQFITSVSHELRSPLNAIMGFAEAMKAGLAGELPDRARNYVGNILGASHVLSQLITSILDLAAIQAGFLDLHRQDQDLVEILRTACNEAREDGSAVPERVGTARLEVPADLTDDGTVRVLADRERLRDAFSALIHSCLTETGYRVDVMVRLTLPTNPDEEGPMVTITMAEGDLPPGALLALVNPRHAAASGRHAGSEVGLALARNVLELHGVTLSLLPPEYAPLGIECRFAPVDASE